jgi:hypothetical protein
MQQQRQKIKKGPRPYQVERTVDRGQMNYAAPELSAFRIFNAQEMPLFWSQMPTMRQL